MKAKQARDIAMSVIQHNIKDDPFYKRIKAEIEKAAYEGKFHYYAVVTLSENYEPTVFQLKMEGFIVEEDSCDGSISVTGLCISWK